MRFEQYTSMTITLSPEGKLIEQALQYTWDGTVYRKAVWPSRVNRDEFRTASGALELARRADERDIGAYLVDNVAYIGSEEVAMLRLAINRGYTSLETVLFAFGSAFLADFWWGFAVPQNLPDALTEEQEDTFLRVFGQGANLRVRDVLLKPNNWINTDTIDSPSDSWSVPAGTAKDQAIAAAWLDHPSSLIAQAARDIQAGQPVSAPELPQALLSVPYALASTPHVDLIAKAYLAFFLRPADGIGFNFYADMLAASGGDWTSMTAGFGSSPEYLQTYAGFTTLQCIDAIYMNLFDRSAEPAALEYWGSRLDSGAFSINNIALSILVGAQNDDAAVVNNRVTVAKAFTNALGTWGRIDAYDGLEAAATARDLLRSVTEDPASTAAAQGALGRWIKTMGASGQVSHAPAGDSITLRPAADRDIIIFGGQDAGKRDTIIDFAAQDVLDFSAFELSSAVVIRTTTRSRTENTTGLFDVASLILEKVGADTYVYVDANEDGDFEPARDLVIRLVGSVIDADAIVV